MHLVNVHAKPVPSLSSRGKHTACALQLCWGQQLVRKVATFVPHHIKYADNVLLGFAMILFFRNMLTIERQSRCLEMQPLIIGQTSTN